MIQTDQRKLGASELVVPALGVGVMSWGENLLGYGKSYAREDVMEAYRACLDAGLVFFDTAEMYGRGESERLLGECRRKEGRPILKLRIVRWSRASSPANFVTELISGRVS